MPDLMLRCRYKSFERVRSTRELRKKIIVEVCEPNGAVGEQGADDLHDTS